MNYRFIGLTARFYPDIRDSEGKSLMAESGAVFDFEGLPPSDGLWVPAEDAPSEAGPVQEAPRAVEEAPEPPPAPVTPDPTPEPAPVLPQTPEPAPVEQAEPAPVQAPVPAPAPEPARAPSLTLAPQASATPPASWSFPGFAPAIQPYTR